MLVSIYKTGNTLDSENRAVTKTDSVPELEQTGSNEQVYMHVYVCVCMCAYVVVISAMDNNRGKRSLRRAEVFISKDDQERLPAKMTCERKSEGREGRSRGGSLGKSVTDRADLAEQRA